MRQLLMLAFYCEVYRREPQCRVYVNDVLMDEFHIPHAHLENTFILDKVLDPALWSENQFILQSKDMPFLKLLEFDDAGAGSLDLRIEINNNDNNYANGFMTHYTRIMLRQCWLAPVKVWEQFDKIYYRWKFNNRNNWQKYFGKKKSIAYYYKEGRNSVLENLAIYADMHFPDITQQLQSKKQTKLIYSNYQDVPSLQYKVRHWIGSSGHFHLALAKKLGFWRHSTDRNRGWWKLSKFNNVKDIYDKYRKYEDTRNNDQ